MVKLMGRSASPPSTYVWNCGHRDVLSAAVSCSASSTLRAVDRTCRFPFTARATASSIVKTGIDFTMTSAPFCVDGEGGFEPGTAETWPCCAEAVEADVTESGADV